MPLENPGGGGLIANAMQSVGHSLNDFLLNKIDRPDDWLVLSNVIDHDGKVVGLTEGKLVMSLINLQQETTISTYRSSVPSRGGDYVNVAAPLYLNMEILFYANSAGSNADYLASLNLISAVIGFFQANPVFTRDALPALDPAIDKLAFEFLTLDLTTLSYVMGLMGTKYLPCVMYKVRVLPFQAGAMREDVTEVRAADVVA
jgi:hypothetical protein